MQCLFHCIRLYIQYIIWIIEYYNLLSLHIHLLLCYFMRLALLKVLHVGSKCKCTFINEGCYNCSIMIKLTSLYYWALSEKIVNIISLELAKRTDSGIEEKRVENVTHPSVVDLLVRAVQINGERVGTRSTASARRGVRFWRTRSCHHLMLLLLAYNNKTNSNQHR